MGDPQFSPHGAVGDQFQPRLNLAQSKEHLSMSRLDLGQPWHHVTNLLSELSYYLYLACKVSLTPVQKTV
jgi:hypothetical protein